MARASLRHRFAAFGCALLTAAMSCASRTSQEIAVDEFRHYGDTPLEHTLYLGSDANYHYFAWSRGKTGGYWHVRKSDMPFRCEFARGDREALLVYDGSGAVQPYLPGCEAGAPAA